MGGNPYTRLYGKQPNTFIPRADQVERVLDEFCESEINEQAYVIVGVRGSGKTVFLTKISAELKKRKDWIVVDLNPERNLLEDFVSSLGSEKQITSIFREAKINLSFLGLGVEIQGADPVTNTQVAARLMLESLNRKGKRVLVTLDELTNSKSTREFTHAFQSFIRDELPVFFLATGLYENINEIENDKGNTFFMRTPKIEMTSLRIRAVADNYQSTFHLDDETALTMARMTNGYPFAFQVLGYYTWSHDGDYLQAESQYKRYIYANAYEKIWSGLSHNDKVFAYGIAKSDTGKTSEIREIIQWGSEKIGPYRKRLQDHSLINTEKYGYTQFILPYFDDFVIEKYEDMLAFEY